MNTKKALVLSSIFVASVLFASCDNTWRYTKQCVDGVSYLEFASGVAVQVDLAGRPVGCK